MELELSLKVSSEGGTVVIHLFKDRDSPRSYKEFTCFVSAHGREYRADIPAADLQELLQMVRSATVSVSGRCGMGFDGISYELSIEDGGARASYRWWMNPATGWEQLVVIANRLLHLGFQVSGQYLP